MSATRDRINTFFKYKDLLRELVVRDVKLKYRRSFFGICLEYFESVIDHAGNDTGVFTDVPERY